MLLNIFATNTIEKTLAMLTKSNLLSVLLVIFFLSAAAQNDKAYYISKSIDQSFEKATESVKKALKEQGFGTITEINMHDKLAEKDFEILPYKILGVCNPGYAYKTLQVEENIGLFLPCKVLVKYIDENTSEVVMVNPSVLMGMLGNKELVSVASDVTEKFKEAMNAL